MMPKAKTSNILVLNDYDLDKKLSELAQLVFMRNMAIKEAVLRYKDLTVTIKKTIFNCLVGYAKLGNKLISPLRDINFGEFYRQALGECR